MHLLKVRFLLTGAKNRIQSQLAGKTYNLFTSTSTRNNLLMRSLSATSKGPEKSKEQEIQQKTLLSSGQKLKKAITEYGTTVIVFHVTISLVSLGICYVIVSSGLDVEKALANFNAENWLKEHSVLVSNAGTFAVAYGIHKMLAPVRIGITLSSVPFIVNYLRRKGFLKK